MSKILKISEATSIALHAMAMLAARKNRMITAAKIATAHNVSEAHLAKVMQRLARAGLVRAIRGPKGGFELARPGNEISLLEIYEVIEGPLGPADCLLGDRICDGKKCVLGGLLQEVETEARDYLEKTMLSDVVGIYKKEGG